MTSSERSLAKGSAAPGPVPEGLVRLYSMRFCPFSQRVRLVVLAKGIKHEIVNINTKNKPDWFYEKSPMGEVPSIETCNGKIIYESPIICEYLDEAFPEVKLLPSDPYAKAEQKMLLETYSAIQPPLYKLVSAKKNNEDSTELQPQFFEKFNKLEEALVKKNTSYFGGESVSMIDYLMWPWFERFSVYGVKDVFKNSPKVKAWHDRMLQDPAVKKTFTKPEVIQEFFKLYSQKSVEAADYGLK